MVAKRIRKPKSRVKRTLTKRLTVFKQPATISGMVAGAVDTLKPDIKTGKQLLQLFENIISGFDYAIDIAGGIGRVIKQVIAPRFDNIDIQDLKQEYLDKAQKMCPKIGKHYCGDIQDFNFERSYDCIWIQWGLCWIKSDDLLVEFLERARDALKAPIKKGRSCKSGLLFIKENVIPHTTKGEENTYGKSRTVSHMSKLFEKAGLNLIYSQLDHNYP